MADGDDPFEEGGIFGDNPGIKWTRDHGEDPDKWPLPPGQPLSWGEWAREVSAEGVRQKYSAEDFFPWDEEDIRWAATTCWVEDWVLGKTPEQTIRDNK